ncbi:glycosyltransferase family 4 protein [Pectinatus brassicae]|uniref:Glycosyltransferase involved in cell wall biosynthesis n=1 Tax=Pectinatus brassicae TaxID=862415 RepID=A0A840UJW0_9FIRM|nr:glycosyltransferase family 4 protein [Pectinatus brassicae]MBB5335927.1 glycosyltransferase involved in cell wall biosynthesis [Pectinatus brassicae]
MINNNSIKNIMLLVPRMNIGGAESHVAMLAPLLVQKGYNVIVVSGGGKLAQSLSTKGIKQVFLPLRLSTDFAAFCLKFIIKKYHINLIHAHSAAAGISAMKCKIKYYPSLPVVYTAHGIFGNIKEKLLLKCDKIIAVSNFVRQAAIKNGVSSDKITTIYNGIDTKKFISNNNRSTIRNKYAIPQNVFCPIIISRIKNLHNKGHQHLIDIFANYASAKDWHLLIIGTGKGKWQLRWQIFKNGLSNRVHFLGHKPDVENYLSAADAVVLPSYFETFGLVLAEGMAAQLPAIAYDVGGINEIINTNTTGFLVSYGDTASLSRKLNDLSKDKLLREKMGISARNDVKYRFSTEKMLTSIIDIYSSF